MAASADPEVRCIILRANGKHFSSGHDLRDRFTQVQFPPRGVWRNFAPTSTEGKDAMKVKSMAEGLFSREREIYLDLCERWRSIPKPTICAVQGKCIAGGLMLCWPCDIIVASTDATFVDMTVAMGVCGIEYFAHGFEVGIRKAKEMLFTGDSISAEDGKRLGMVNHGK